jgi:alpha/beta superfamily hydrolase
MSRPPAGQTRHPAIVWIVGGFPPGGLPDDAWLEQPARNDQSAAQFMRAGVITLYPTTRGMEGNAGLQESFLGEVADVVAAVEWLRAQPFVDPARVYVGGHSTGGTLALLAGASTQVTGVISYGPVENVCGYGLEPLTFDARSEPECAVRSPQTYTHRFPPSVIVEGARSPNAASVRGLSRWPSEGCSYVVIPDCDHFIYIAALNEYFAQQLVKGAPLTLTAEQASAIVTERFPATVVESGGWRVTIPADFDESPREDSARAFNNGQAMMIVSVEEQDPVTCEGEGAIKARDECFERETQTIEGTEWVYVTAQRGTALFVTAIGPRAQEKAVLTELVRVLDTAKAAPPSH